jgi:two-component system, NtrC family, sensor kinase
MQKKEILLTKPRIMIIDDDPSIILIIKKFIGNFGYSIFTEMDSLKALESVRTANPHLILLDIEMPGLNGFQVLEKLKMDESLKTIPVIFLSSDEKISSKIKVFEAGAVDYLVKPVHLRELEIRIKTQIRLAENKQKLEQYAHDMEKLAQERAAQLIHTDRLSTLGTLAAGVAHEINNPAAFIMTNLKALESYCSFIQPHIEKIAEERPAETQYNMILKEMPKVFDDMRSGVERISSIVNTLTDYSRKREHYSDAINFADCIRDAVVFTNHRLKNIKTELNIPSEKCLVIGSRQQLTQVVTNLITNASDAVEGLENPKVTISLNLKPDRIILSIQDNGPGVPLNVIEQIWTPFFTTKAPGVGTGLGLSICQSIIQNHKGKLSVKNSSNSGACFDLELPCKKG